MKKFLSLLSLVLVFAMLCTVLVSCGGPADTPEEAAAALKENGYTVTVESDSTVIASKNDEYIAIQYFDNADDAEAAYAELEEELAEAEEELEKAQKELDEARAELEDMDDGWAKDLAEAGVKLAEEAVKAAEKLANAEIGQSGNVVWYGTSQAVKDAK